MILLWCRRAEVRRLCRFAIIAVLVWGAMPILSVYAETTIVPLASVRSRYDSNVFRRPKQLLLPGTQAEDFVTAVGAGLDLLHKSRDIDADVKMGGFFNTYLENTDRNFFAATLQGHVVLNNWVDQYARGAKLMITQNLRYTPEQPSFISGARESFFEEDILVRGVQGFRANTLMNTTAFKGEYRVSRDVSVEGEYIFGLRRIGTIQGGGAVAGITTYFNTMTHTWSGGPRYQLTRNDSVAVLYRQTFIMQSRVGGGRDFNTNLISLQGDYSKNFQEWGFSLRGGLTFAEPVGRTFPSGTLEIRTKPERDTVARLSISREGRPSYFLVGGAIISNVGTLGVSHKFYERLELDGSVSYAFNEYFPDTTKTYKNLTARSKLAYNITRDIIGELYYLYQNIENDSSSIQFQYGRHEAGIMLTLEWK